jgi:hypothetical protein
MTTRNRCFRVAALLAAASYLILGARYLIEADHLFRGSLPGGYQVAALINVAARLIGAAGWIAIATAFGDEIDWHRLRRAAAIVILAYVATFAGTVSGLLPTLADYHRSALRGVYFWTTVGALLNVVGAVVAVSGFAGSRRGASRRKRLRLGMMSATGAAVAATFAEFAQHAYYSEQGYVHELRTGALIVAIAQVVIALATLAVALRVGDPPTRREARLAAAATGAAVATLGAVVGEAMIAVGYDSHGAPTWQDFGVWLGVAYSLGAAAMFGVIARGARSVASAEGVGAAEQ